MTNDFMHCNNIVFSQTDVLSAFNKLKLSHYFRFGKSF